MKQARSSDTEIDPSVFDFLEALLSGDLVAAGRSGFSRHAVLRFAMKLQQYSGPVMAKGMEDTAFYRYNRLIALNEVGGHPELFGIAVANFHKLASQRARYWPHSMVTTSTHDTKRGEDSRARLAVLSEMHGQWASQVRLWSHMLRARRGDIESAAPPDANDEYLFYQMLLGSWPAEITSCAALAPEALRDYAERLKQAMLKSIREAKVHSTWAAPNLAYEEAALAFVEAALDPCESRAFFAEFLPFQRQIAHFGMENSLAQTVLKLTMPGVPDIYQGSELWDLSLVDPDNRRPVDYGLRLKMLKDLDARKESFRELMDRWPDGTVKLFITQRLLQLRAEDPDLFASGGYEPLPVSGAKSDCVCAFARIQGCRAVVAIVARFPFRRSQDPEWHDTTVAIPAQLSRCVFKNVFTGSRLAVTDIESAIGVVFDGSPVAVLTVDQPTSPGSTPAA
jgi:(1->4)-alpha-D-glucan 1-alpha-D-glucosylmutase